MAQGFDLLFLRLYYFSFFMFINLTFISQTLIVDFFFYILQILQIISCILGK